MELVVSLELFKKHCKADDYSCDDDLLLQCLQASQEFVIRETNRTVEELTELNEDGEFPKPLQLAIMNYGRQLYDSGVVISTQSFSVVPYGFEALVRPYVKLV